MAYTRYVYNRVNWKNKNESLETPLGKSNLNRMDSAIFAIAENLDIAYNEFSTGKLNESDANKMLAELPIWNKDTGVLSFKFHDGTTFSVDFNIEKIPISFSMNTAGVITMTTADGTEWTADIGSLIPDYVFKDGDRIAFKRVKNEDGSYTVTADIIKGSITAECLETNYLAQIMTESSKAQASAKSASDSADNADYDAKLAQSYAVGNSNLRENENVDNAKYYKEQAEKFSQQADTSVVNAKASEDNAKASEQAAKQSEDNAKTSEDNAKISEQAAKNSETNAKTSENNAKASEDAAKEYREGIEEYAKIARSYTEGDTDYRENEIADNAKYYYQQSKQISEGLNGALLPMATISFSQLSIQTKSAGYMYNISDNFISDESFKDGGNIPYPAGTNVYYTADGYWDCLAGKIVAGVKGNAENDYRQGYINLTPENIGTYSKDEIDNQLEDLESSVNETIELLSNRIKALEELIESGDIVTITKIVDSDGNVIVTNDGNGLIISDED